MTLYFLYDIAPILVTVLNMSINAGYAVIAVILLRIAMKRSPRWIVCLLWSFVGIRLVIPYSFESALSIIPSIKTIPDGFLDSAYPTVDSGISVVDRVVGTILPDLLPTQVNDVIYPAHEGMATLSLFWLMGIAVMMIYMTVSYVKVKRSVREAIKQTDNIYLCDSISSPFILGVINPKIYLPFGMSEEDMRYVILHERAHLKRCDHITKSVGYLLLAVYWFAPLVWISYILMCRDIELACDDAVIKELGADVKKQYSNALINCAASRKTAFSCPLAFGEVGVKTRIKNVLKYKKPAFLRVTVSVLLSVIACVCLLTDPASKIYAIDDSANSVEHLTSVLEGELGIKFDDSGYDPDFNAYAKRSKMPQDISEWIIIYEFVNSEKAKETAQWIDPYGSVIRYVRDFNITEETIIDYTHVPNWYLHGKCIVLYIGGEESTLDILQNELGDAFAGYAAQRNK